MADKFEHALDLGVQVLERVPVPVLDREQRVDVVGDILRQEGGRVALHHPTLRVDQELLKVPRDVALLHRSPVDTGSGNYRFRRPWAEALQETKDSSSTKRNSR